MASLLDFDPGKAVQLGISLDNLEQTKRRNDILEENSLLEAGRLKVSQESLKLQQEKIQQQMFQDVMALEKDPRVRANPELSNAVIKKAWGLAGLPEVSEKLLNNGRDKMRGLLTGLMKGNQEESADAFIELQILAGPDDAKKMVDAASTTQKLGEYSESVEAMRTLQRARFEKINDSMSKVNAGLAPYTQASHEFARLLDGTDSKEFMSTVVMTERLRKSKDVSTKNIGTLMGGEATTKWTGSESEQYAEHASQISSQYKALAGAAQGKLIESERGKPLDEGTTKRDLEERAIVGLELGDAYQDIADWLRDPFDRGKLKAAKKAEALVEARRKQIEGLKTSTAEESLQIRRDALTFRQTEAGKTHQHNIDIGNAQTAVLGKYGYNPSAEQVAEVARQFPGVKPEEILHGIGDPAKRGKVEVGVKFGQEDTTRNLKMIESAQGVVDFAGELSDRIRKNPMIVGAGAQFSTAVAGSMQQLRAIVQLDPGASKFLNTKTRDEAEAFYETLVYMQARTMDPSGPLDLKVVEHAREVLGPLSSFTAGPQQLLNKLDTVTQNAHRSIRRARRRLKEGVSAYLTDEPQESKPLSEQSDEELMKTILQGIGQ